MMLMYKAGFCVHNNSCADGPKSGSLRLLPPVDISVVHFLAWGPVCLESGMSFGSPYRW